MVDNETALYDGRTRTEWKKELDKHSAWNRKYLYGIFALFGTPSVYLDVGCGTGDMVNVCRMLQVNAFGIDQIINDEFKKDIYFEHDLRKSFALTDHTDYPIANMVTCLEVAEHIPEEYHEVLAGTLCNHLDRAAASVLIFSAASPGQGGSKHEAEKHAPYWRDMFHRRGVKYNEQMTFRLKLIWQLVNGPMFWLPGNVQVFAP